MRILGVEDEKGLAAGLRNALEGEREGSVVLTVDDDGAGIPVADRERIPERSVRLDDARAREGGGAGLGLAIVAEVVGAHGGKILASGSPLGGHGSRCACAPKAAHDINAFSGPSASTLSAHTRSR